MLQAVILFRPETSVLTPGLDTYLEGFHHRAVQKMVGMVPKRKWDGTWVYPPIGAALEMVWMEKIRVYISRC